MSRPARWGAKSVGEIGINGPIPTIANAIYDAVGVRLTETPVHGGETVAGAQGYVNCA